MSEKETYTAYHAIKINFDTLARLGYFKIIMRELSPFKRRLHECYKIFVWSLVFLYNIQHVIRVIEMRNDTEQVVNTLFILLTTLNTLGKQLTFNLKTKRIDNLIDVINGPIFAPTSSFHIEKIKENGVTMARVLKLYIFGVIACGSLWALFPLVNRFLGEDVHFTGYIPFDTSTSPAFELSVVYMNAAISLQGLANVTMDCTIAGFYALAMVQFQILRHDFEHLTNDCDIKSKKGQRFIDENDTVKKILRRRLISYVIRHQKIKWSITETESIFAESLTFQFFITAWVICTTVYKIVGLTLLSVEFFSILMYLVCMLAQFFIYCYYGTQVKYESDKINQSIYCCDWLQLTPKFRNQILIVMENCKHSVIPRTAYVIPISMESYISVLRASYTLFTFLRK